MKSQARGWVSWPPRLAASLLPARSLLPGPRLPSRGLHAVGTLITSGPSAATRDPPLGIPSLSRQLNCVFWKPWPPCRLRHTHTGPELGQECLGPGRPVPVLHGTLPCPPAPQSPLDAPSPSPQMCRFMSGLHRGRLQGHQAV